MSSRNLEAGRIAARLVYSRLIVLGPNLLVGDRGTLGLLAIRGGSARDSGYGTPTSELSIGYDI